MIDWWVWFVIGFVLGGISVLGLFWWFMRDYLFVPSDWSKR